MDAQPDVVQLWELARQMCGCGTCVPAHGTAIKLNRPCQVEQAFHALCERAIKKIEPVPVKLVPEEPQVPDQGSHPWPSPLQPYPWDSASNEQPCLHLSCPTCGGTGQRLDGLGMCIHMISCSCPRCSPRAMMFGGGTTWSSQAS